GERAWAGDVNGETRTDRAGPSFAVKRDKGEFVGRDALREPGQKVVCVVIDDPRAIAVGYEQVRAVDGRIVGRVTSGGFGYAVGSSIALAYVPLEYTEPGTQLAVDIFGDWVAAEVRVEPLYDPKGERVRAW